MRASLADQVNPDTARRRCCRQYDDQTQGRNCRESVSRSTKPKESQFQSAGAELLHGFPRNNSSVC
jgi:hypothetical protein